MIAMDANPSIEEMRHDLETGKAAGIDFFRKHEYTPKCSRCGNQHPAWWYLQNGVRYCNECASRAHENPEFRFSIVDPNQECKIS